MDEATIDICVNYIKAQECVLMLGPEFARDSDNNKLSERITEELENSNFKDKLDHRYENLFLFRDKKPSSIQKMQLNIALKSKYSSAPPHEVYDLIPEIPFTAIISCSPDKYLQDSFDERSIGHSFRYYSLKGAIDQDDKIKESETLIYNLFGTIADEDSLITTYDGFYEFIMSVIGEKQRFPDELANRIKDSRIFVMMGFDLTKWYMPLLIHKLNTYKDSDETPALVNSNSPYDEFSIRNFPIDFMFVEHNSQDVIKAIHSKFQPGELRSSSKEDSKEIEELRQIVIDNDFEEAFSLLRNALKDRNMQDEVTILGNIQGTYNEYHEEEMDGTISHERLNNSKALTRKKLFKLIDQL